MVTWPNPAALGRLASRALLALLHWQRLKLEAALDDLCDKTVIKSENNCYFTDADRRAFSRSSATDISFFLEDHIQTRESQQPLHLIKPNQKKKNQMFLIYF